MYRSPILLQCGIWTQVSVQDAQDNTCAACNRRISLLQTSGLLEAVETRCLVDRRREETFCLSDERYKRQGVSSRIVERTEEDTPVGIS